jgi:hypothetical protein
MPTRSHKLKVQDVCAVDSEKVHDNGYVEFPMAWLANDQRKIIDFSLVHVVLHKGNTHLD